MMCFMIDRVQYLNVEDYSISGKYNSVQLFGIVCPSLLSVIVFSWQAMT